MHHFEIASSGAVVTRDLSGQLFVLRMNRYEPTMVRDLITEEIRETRHRLAGQFNNDVSRIGDDLRRRQSTSGRRVVQLPKRLPRTNEMLKKLADQSGAPSTDR